MPVPCVVATLFLFAVAFLIGAVPFAYLFVKKIKGIDIRSQGSGNSGATNAGRILGKRMGVFILVLDALKGMTAAGLLTLLLLKFHSGVSAEFIESHLSEFQLLFGIGAFLGHCYSPFLGFRGGKGVATALGVYLIVAPKALLATLAICIVIILATHIISIASIFGAILLPIGIWAFYHDQRPFLVLGVTLVLSFVVVFRHRANIVRLLSGTELDMNKKATTNGEGKK